MPNSLRQVPPVVRIAVPVVVAAVLVCLALLNIAFIYQWHEADDGVLWQSHGVDVVAEEVSPGSAGDRSGVKPGDALLTIDGLEIEGPRDVVNALHAGSDGTTLTYRLSRGSTQQDFSVTLRPLPTVDRGVYYPLAVVGLLSIVLGASVRLRRPNDPATLHFFWLAVAFGGMFAFRYSGRLDHFDYFFLWSNEVAHLALPPLFLHFALVFPDRPQPWIRTAAGRVAALALYLPVVALGLARIGVMRHGVVGHAETVWLERLNALDLAYLSLCLAAGLVLMIKMRRRMRSTTARRQLRWIVWGLSIGAVPFITLYAVPFVFGHAPAWAGYTAPLLVLVPLAFASAIARYRLMDVEVIIKWTLMMAAVAAGVITVFFGTLWGVEYIFGTDNQHDTEHVAMVATLIVVIVFPWLKDSIQAALDRLYYRDRYDYRRALVSFARELNSDLDLDRLSTRLVTRIRDTLVVDRIALLLAEPNGQEGDFTVVASLGLDDALKPSIARVSLLGLRLSAGQTVVIDDPLPVRRFGGEQAGEWRELGLLSFVPCVSKDLTIAVLAVGRKGRSEPLSSEDMTLLGAVASQAATALENARLYGQLRVKAEEIERLRQFSDSVVESLSDGLLVVDLEDCVVRCNHRLEQMLGVDQGRAVGRRLTSFFDKPFQDSLYAARRDAPDGATLYRVPLTPVDADVKRSLLVNVGIAPLRTTEGTRAGSIIMLEDVTDRANLEEQLRLSEKMAAIGLLAAGVAHEVNTPLTGISSFTQMLLSRADPNDPNTQLLEKIERQTFRAAKIVNSLLNLAKPSDGETGPVDLGVVIGDVLSLLEHQLRASHIQVRKDLAGPIVVRGVEYKLQQVFLNLFLNARDAMTKGGWLSVTTSRDERGAIVEVSDTGAGIPTEHIARIYDPFFTTKPEGRGTGLGLSVSYGIVQEHGGSLTCDSAAGQGTTFTLVLPLAESASTMPAQLADGRGPQ
jgi:PAS domain S-box-containing protein